MRRKAHCLLPFIPVYFFSVIYTPWKRQGFFKEAQDGLLGIERRQ